MSYNLFIDSDDDVGSSNGLSDTVEYRQPCSQVRVLQRRLQSAWGGNRRSNSFSVAKQITPLTHESNSLPSSPVRKSIVNQFSFAKIWNSAQKSGDSQERLNEYFFESGKPSKMVATVNRWVLFLLILFAIGMAHKQQIAQCAVHIVQSEIYGFRWSVIRYKICDLTEKQMSDCITVKACDDQYMTSVL